MQKILNMKIYPISYIKGEKPMKAIRYLWDWQKSRSLIIQGVG